MYSNLILFALSISVFILPMPWLEQSVDAAQTSGEPFTLFAKVATVFYLLSGLLFFLAIIILILQAFLYLFTGVSTLIELRKSPDKNRLLQITGLHLLALFAGGYWLFYLSGLIYESPLPFALEKSQRIILALLASAWLNNRLKKLTIPAAH